MINKEACSFRYLKTLPYPPLNVTARNTCGVPLAIMVMVHGVLTESMKIIRGNRIKARKVLFALILLIQM